MANHTSRKVPRGAILTAVILWVGHVVDGKVTWYHHHDKYNVGTNTTTTTTTTTQNDSRHRFTRYRKDDPSRRRRRTFRKVLHQHEVTQTPRFVVGTLGTMDMAPIRQQQRRRLTTTNTETNDKDDSVLKEMGVWALQGVVQEHMGGSGNEIFVPAKQQTYIDPDGGTHIKYQETIRGLPIEGTAMFLHVLKDGTISGVNGEFVSEEHIQILTNLDCEIASARALSEIQKELPGAEWIQEGCEDAAIYNDTEGMAYLALKRLLGYQPAEGPYQKDLMFFRNDRILARHPRIMGKLQVHTVQCNSGKSCSAASSGATCSVAFLGANSSVCKLSEDDYPRDFVKANNYAIATYDFFYNQYGRDSIDGNGMRLVSRVSWGNQVNNAFWDGVHATYGDGDGWTFGPLSEGIDVVAHELTHGITDHTSGLIYSHESGALNEAMSDIFGAVIHRQEGASRPATWKIGEDIYTPTSPGDALRYMDNPTLDGYSADYYPERLIGSGDNGGVHGNSGIANLAFFLLVTGGQHPRGKTTVNVPAIDANFDTSLLKAAEIFYRANTDCLTPNSNFALARTCTVQFAGSYRENVEKAWDAVGVKFVLHILENNVARTEESANSNEVTYYKLEGVLMGEKITCSLDGDNGDADLYVRFGDTPIPDYQTNLNDCKSISSTSQEECTTETSASQDTDVYIAVHAWTGYHSLAVLCWSVGSLPSPTSQPSETPPTQSPTEPQPTQVPTIAPTVTLTTLTSGLPYVGLARNAGEIEYFELPGIEAGESLACALDGPNGDADLFVRLNELPELSISSDINYCSSFLPTSQERCMNYPIAFSSTAYIAIHAYSSFTDLSVTCRRYPAEIQLLDGVPLPFQTGVGGFYQMYEFDVVAGAHVTCSTGGAPDQDVDLYVRFSIHPFVNVTATENDCQSTGLGTHEECKTSTTAPSNTKAYVAVDAITSVTELTITCTSFLPTCAARRESCSQLEDCCDPTTIQTCDRGKCKKCRNEGDFCKRHTQCCSGRCNRRKNKCRRFK